MSSQTYANIRAFIVTPFSKKKDSAGNLIDFDAVREQLIEKALNELDIKGRTTTEIVRAGSIHADMFQLLLTADIVVAEVSIHNANVFYELGIRHALRQQGTVMLRGEDEEGKQNDAYPFDLQGFRYLTYKRNDPAAAVNDLIRTLRETIDAPDQDSPVFRSLPALREQARSNFLHVPVDFREEVEQALAGKQRGDLDLLAMEASGFQWGREGLRVVGRAQIDLKDFEGAKESWEEIRKDYPNDKEANERLGTIYQRLGDLTRSDQALDRLLANADTTPYERAEAYTLQGRNAKTRWIMDWKGDDANQHPATEWPERALRSPYLQESFELCQKGFGEDLNHFYSGLNALAMLKVTIELATQLGAVWAERFDDEDEAAQKLASLVKDFDKLAPSVGLSIKAVSERIKREADATKDSDLKAKKLAELRWARISSADLFCLTSKIANRVKTEYQNSLTGAEDFYCDAASKQLILYRELGILTANVNAALEVATPQAQGAETEQEQPHVFVFTGHRIDDDDRVAKGKGKRFPKEMESVAREAIRKAIADELKRVNKKAVGIAGGANGGDILFHEVCAELGIQTQLYLVLPREKYIEASVQGAGNNWVQRFNNLYNTLKRRELDAEDLPRWLRQKGDQYNIWQRSNLWILNNAIALDKKGGGSNLTLIALWNGKEGDAAGGTEDMVAQAGKRGALTINLPTEELFGIADAQTGNA